MEYHVEEWTPERVLAIAKGWRALEDDLHRFTRYCLERLQDEMSEPHTVRYELTSVCLDSAWSSSHRFKAMWVRQTCDEEFRDIVKKESFCFWFSPAELALGAETYFSKFLREFKANNTLEEKRARDSAFYEYKRLKERWGFE